MFNFDGAKYNLASAHQKEWGNELISAFPFTGHESILDLGCGDGVLTAKLAELVPNGKVVGIDASAGMIHEANKRKKRNLTFIQMDMNEINYTESFDFIYSNAALHWVKDHHRLLENSKKALKKGGIINWSFGGYGNCLNLNETLAEAINLPEFQPLFAGFEWPWYMPTAEQYKKLAEGFGFSAFHVSLENADRYFDNASAMILWIDQPCIVPFLDYLPDNPAKTQFRNSVIHTMLLKCKNQDGKCFETFRRLKVLAKK